MENIREMLEQKYLKKKGRFDAMRKDLKLDVCPRDVIKRSEIMSIRPTFYEFIKYNFKVSGKIMYWFIAKKLGVRKIIRQYREPVDVEKVIRKTLNLLKKENPSEFNLAWIKEQNKKLAEDIQTCSVGVDGSVDCRLFFKMLGDEWHAKSDYRECRRDRTKEACIAEIITVYEQKKPTVLNPEWFMDNVRNEADFLLNEISDTRNEENWLLFLGSFPAGFKNIWSYDASRDWTFELAVARIIFLCRELKPDYINKHWVESVDNGLYLWIIRNIRTDDGKEPDWIRVARALPTDIQTLWSNSVGEERQEIIKKRKRSQGYYSKKEVDAIYHKYDGSAYVILVAKDRNDRTVRAEILKELVSEAQRGNYYAREKLLLDLEIIASEWVIKGQLSCFGLFYQDMLRSIESCIDNYAHEHSFISYLYRSLLARSRGLYVPMVELDNNPKGRKTTYHEKIFYCDIAPNK